MIAVIIGAFIGILIFIISTIQNEEIQQEKLSRKHKKPDPEEDEEEIIDPEGDEEYVSVDL